MKRIIFALSILTQACVTIETSVYREPIPVEVEDAGVLLDDAGIKCIYQQDCPPMTMCIANVWGDVHGTCRQHTYCNDSIQCPIGMTCGYASPVSKLGQCYHEPPDGG